MRTFGLKETTLFGRKGLRELRHLSEMNFDRPEQVWLLKQTEMFLTVLELTSGITEEERLQIPGSVRAFVQDTMNRSPREVYRTAYAIERTIAMRNRAWFGSVQPDNTNFVFTFARLLYEDIGIDLFEKNCNMFGTHDPERVRALGTILHSVLDFAWNIDEYMFSKTWLTLDTDELVLLSETLELAVIRNVDLMAKTGVGILCNTISFELAFLLMYKGNPLSEWPPKAERMRVLRRAYETDLTCSQANMAIFMSAVGSESHQARRVFDGPFGPEIWLSKFTNLPYFNELKDTVVNCQGIEADRIFALVNYVPKSDSSLEDLMLETGLRVLQKSQLREYLPTIESNLHLLERDVDKFALLRMLISRGLFRLQPAQANPLRMGYMLSARFGFKNTQLPHIDRQLLSSLIYWPSEAEQSSTFWEDWARFDMATKEKHMQTRKIMVQAKKYEESSSLIPSTAGGSVLQDVWSLAIARGVKVVHLHVPDVVRLVPKLIRGDNGLVKQIAENVNGYPVWINKLLVEFDKLYRERMIYQPRFGLNFFYYVIRGAFAHLVCANALGFTETPRFSAAVTALYRTIDDFIRKFPQNPTEADWESYLDIVEVQVLQEFPHISKKYPILGRSETSVSLLEGPIADKITDLAREISTLISHGFPTL
jgi:hypothetical protein